MDVDRIDPQLDFFPIKHKVVACRYKIDLTLSHPNFFSAYAKIKTGIQRELRTFFKIFNITIFAQRNII